MKPVPLPDDSGCLFDSIAELLPAHLREHFYRRMAHFRSLAPNDELLQIAEAMGFLALLIRETPGAIAEQRQQFERLLGASVQSVQSALDAAANFPHLLDIRLAQLPDAIQTGIDPEAITAKITESLLQQFAQTGLPAVAQEMAIHTSSLTATSRQLSAILTQFSDPNSGALHRLHAALCSMQADLGSAADHVRSLTHHLRQELLPALALLCLGATVIGFFLGIAYVHSR